MVNLDNLRDEIERSIGQIDELVGVTDDGGYKDIGSVDWTDDKSKDVNAKLARVEMLQNLERAHKRESGKSADDIPDAEDVAQRVAKEVAAKVGISEDEATVKRLEFNANVLRWAIGGHWDGNSRNSFKYEDRGIDFTNFDPQAALSTGQTSTGNPSQLQKGGYSVPEEMFSSVVRVMKDLGQMRQVATVRTVPTGRQVDFVGGDATSEEGEIVAENAKATVSDTTLSLRSIKFDQYSSKVIEVPINLLQDTGVDLVDYIGSVIARRIALTQEKAFINGSTVSGAQVMGLLERTTEGAQEDDTAADTYQTDFTFGKILELVHSVDRLYRSNSQFMFSDNVLLTLAAKTISSTDNRPLFLPNITSTDGGRLYGYPYTINAQMPVPAADAKSIAFGDFSAYHILDAREFEFMRFTDSPFALKQQVGFVAFMRSGADLIDGATSGSVAVKHLANSTS